MIRKTVMAGLVAAALAPAGAFAQAPAAPGTAPGASAVSAPAAPASPHTLTGNVGLYSQYIFRGLTQTDGEPALQGGFDYAHSSGLYAGTWASNVSVLRDGVPPVYTAGGSLEWDFYGGYKGTLPLDFTYDLGTLYYWYPGTVNNASPLNIKADTWEVYAGIGWKWLSAKYSYSVSNKTFAIRDSSGSWYLDLSANVPLGDFFKPLDGLTFIAHWGMQQYRGTDPRNAVDAAGTIQSNDKLYSYEDWKLGLSYTLPQNFTVGAFYSDTSGTTGVGYGTPAQGGPYPRALGRGTGTIFVQKTF